MKNILFLTAVLWPAVLLAQACGPIAKPQPISTPESRPSTTSEIPDEKAWQKKWDALTAAARKEGRLVVYSSANPATRNALAKAFQEKYGVDLEYVTGRGTEVVARFLREWRAGIRMADVMVMGAADLIELVKPSGSAEPLLPALILPEVLDAKTWRDSRLPLIDKEGMVLGFLANYQAALVINTEMVKEDQVKSYYDLLQPEWKGKILMADPTVAGMANNWVTFMMVMGLGKEKGRDYMERLAKQEPLIIRDDRLLAEWVAKGKYPIVLGSQNQVIKELRELGAPLKYLRMAEGGFVNTSGGAMVLVTQRPDPSASIVFINWLLSREGQTTFSKNYGVASGRLDVPPEGIDPALQPLPGEKVHRESEEFFSEKARLLPTVKDIFGPLLQR